MNGRVRLHAWEEAIFLIANKLHVVNLLSCKYCKAATNNYFHIPPALQLQGLCHISTKPTDLVVSLHQLSQGEKEKVHQIQ